FCYFSFFSRLPSRNGNAQRWLAWFDCPAKTPRKTRQSPRRLSEITPSLPTNIRLKPHFFGQYTPTHGFYDANHPSTAHIKRHRKTSPFSTQYPVSTPPTCTHLNP
ncbi:unnamed protein product, partial [Ectocarpus sp. 12 AP-2014]